MLKQIGSRPDGTSAGGVRVEIPFPEHVLRHYGNSPAELKSAEVGFSILASHGVGINLGVGLYVLVVTLEMGGGDFRVSYGVIGKNHVIRGKRGAVMPFHVFSEVESIGKPVLRNFPGTRQKGFEFKGLVVSSYKRLVDSAVNDAFVNIGRYNGVKGCGLLAEFPYKRTPGGKRLRIRIADKRGVIVSILTVSAPGASGREEPRGRDHQRECKETQKFFHEVLQRASVRQKAYEFVFSSFFAKADNMSIGRGRMIVEALSEDAISCIV